MPPADPHGYAEAIIELALDPAARFLLGAAAREGALGRDVEPENADLLARYAGLIGVAGQRTAATLHDATTPRRTNAGRAFVQRSVLASWNAGPFTQRSHIRDTSVTPAAYRPDVPDIASTQRILVVDDEADITALVAYHLAKAGYRVTTATGGREALDAARGERPDAVVLDLMLPDLSGYDVLAELRRREETRQIGVLLLTARREEADRIRGLSLGADDYLPKPFSPPELVLRVGAVLRRLRAPAGAVGGRLSAGPILLDTAAHRLTLDGAEIVLTATEFKLLRTLLEREGRVQTRAQLLETVWHAQPDIRTRTVDMHLQRLRRKLGPMGSWIETVRGAGYRFAPRG